MNFLDALEQAKKGVFIRPVNWGKEWNAVYTAKKIDMRLSLADKPRIEWQLFIIYEPKLIGTKKDNSENSRISCPTNINELMGEWEVVKC